MSAGPFFTIITPVYNDAWGLSKTIRSLMMQSFQDFQYVIVDGGSSDGIEDLIHFWEALDLIDVFVSEPDTGVYDAMNKGVALSEGSYVCFLNAGDVFSSAYELQFAYDILNEDATCDGVLGWGKLKNQIWASWYTLSDSVRMASLGFCHQALFLKRRWLEDVSFDTRPEKTDSDTKQLADSISKGARIRIVKRVMAIRAPGDGLSADLERTRKSILETIVSSYESIHELDADRIIAFRRTCSDIDEILRLLKTLEGSAAFDLAIMVLDTLFLKQAKDILSRDGERIMQAAIACIERVGGSYGPVLWRLVGVQSTKVRILEEERRAVRQVRKTAEVLATETWGEGSVQEFRSRDNSHYRISLTTFPARVESLSLMLRSLVQQTVAPAEINLVVGRDEFRNEWAFPKEILEFKKYGLTIHFADRTCHQYDKFIHTMGANEEMPFVLVDDDIIYPPEAMQKLLKLSEMYPDCVIANRCHGIGLDESDRLLQYSQWERDVSLEEPSHALFATGAGGVLYPRGFFAGCADAKTMLSLCPYADDVWLKAMAMMNGRKVKSTGEIKDANWKLGYTPEMHQFALHVGNVDHGLNDLQIIKSMSWLEAQGVNWKAMITGDE